MERLKVLCIGLFWVVYDYFTETKARKVFFFAIAGVLLFSFTAWVLRSNLFWILCSMSIIIALIISCRETKIQRKNFHAEMKIRKAVSTTNENEDKHDFTPDELDYIRRRDRTFRGAFWTKVMFIFLLVVLIVNLW